ncbi:MAG: hypothetical protein ACLR9U_04645 [Lachnospira sp.]
MPQRILKTILIIMLVALLFINVNTVINVNYVRAEEPTTQVITSDNTENENSTELTDTTIQETLSEISNNLNYMLIMQIISLGAFLGYVGIDRLR